MTLLHVSLLGGFACHSAAGQAVALPTRKAQALLAYLAMSAGRAHQRSKLAGLLWEQMPEARARANLRKTLSRLQHSLPQAARDGLTIDVHEVGLAANAYAVDVARFERLMVEETPETLERALALYAGPFLDGLDVCGEAFEQWLVDERRRLEEMLNQLQRRLLNHYVLTGAIEPAIQLALKRLAADALDEDVHRTLIRLYMYQDRIGAALAQYRRCRDLLADELGVAPSDDTVRLHAELAGMVPRARDEPADTSRESDDVPERAGVIETAAAVRVRGRQALGDRPSVAVLALSPQQDATEYAHVSDGVAEDIATELGRFRELDVIAPATARAYRETNVAPERVGAELGVAYVLSSGLRCCASRLIITTRLLETASARQIWAERYDCARNDVFDVQDDVVARIVGSLAGSIEAECLQRSRRQRPGDWRAYDLTLRGWNALRRPDLAAIHEARRYFQQAVAMDPAFARAYVGLALAHLNEWACYSWNHWTFLQKGALDLARKAVNLDDRDHRARCMLGLAELYGGSYEAARRELVKALELNPNDADVLAHASFGLALIGDSEKGVEAARRALRLTPHRPDWYAGMAGIAFFSARLYAEAIEIMATAPEAFCNTPAFIAAAHAHLGHPEQGASHRDTVYRHYRYHLARGAFPADMSCIGWLAALDPYQHRNDAEHYADGLRKAGFQ